MTTMVSRSILTLKQDDLLPIPTPGRFSLIVYDLPQDFGDFLSRDEAIEMATEELTEQICLAGVTAGPISGRMCLNRIGKSDLQSWAQFVEILLATFQVRCLTVLFFHLLLYLGPNIDREIRASLENTNRVARGLAPVV
jgi:hypothetical protein